MKEVKNVDCSPFWLSFAPKYEILVKIYFLLNNIRNQVLENHLNVLNYSLMQWICYLYYTKNYQKYVGFQNQFSLVHSVMFNSLQHGLQHTRLPSASTPRTLLTLMSIESVMPSNQLILCYPLLLLPSIFPSTRVLSSESALCITWPNLQHQSFQ